MSNIRAGMTSLKDPDDDYAFQILKGDVERLRLACDRLAITSGTPAPGTNADLQRITVHVCVDGVEMTMQVLGTTPF